MEAFLIREGDLTLPEWRWLYEPQPISNHPVGLGFPHRAGRFRPGDGLLRPRSVGLLDVWYGRIYDLGMGAYPPRVALALQTPANQQPVSGVGSSTQL